MKRVICLASVPLLGAFVALKAAFPSVYVDLIQEDALVENLQVLLYLAAASYALASAWLLGSGKKLPCAAHLLLGLACLFVAGEEISWGQRVFDFATPAWMARMNTQGELTLHNMTILQDRVHSGYIAVGLYGALGWLFVRRGRLGPDDLRRYCLAEWFCAPYFAPVAVIYVLLHKGNAFLRRSVSDEAFTVGRYLLWRDQEPAELMLALGFLLLAWSNYRKVRQMSDRGFR